MLVGAFKNTLVTALLVLVHWGPAQSIFDTIDLTVSDGLAGSIPASVLVLEGGRKLVVSWLPVGR